MSNKALILFMYLVAVFIVLKHWYKNGGSGMPYPSTITAPSYLYGVLALVADFTGGFSTVLAVGLTFGLYQSVKNNEGTKNINLGAYTINVGGGNLHPTPTPKSTGVKTGGKR